MSESVMTLVSWWKINAQLDLLKILKITRNWTNASRNLHGLANKDWEKKSKLEILY